MGLGPKQMAEAIIRNLKIKTGKSIVEWLEVVSISGLTEKKEVMTFLKNEKGLGHFQAQLVFDHFIGQDSYANPSAFADKIFDSKKAKRLYDYVKSEILVIDEDIKIQPCRTYIPFYRNKQFALLTKTSKDELLIGLNLPENYKNSRFNNSSNRGSERINSEVIIKNESEFDEEIVAAISIAYKNN